MTKTGTGFDHPKMDCLILASDLESYFVQILGRVLRRPDIKPIVFDFVDDNPAIAFLDVQHVNFPINIMKNNYLAKKCKAKV